jgi:spore coat protein B
MEHVQDMSFLESMVGKTLRIYKGGPEAKDGRLLSVADDYLMLDTPEGDILYYSLEHIKTICRDLGKPSLPLKHRRELFEEYLENSDLKEVLQSFKYGIIQVDRGGPESRIGKLLDVGDDFIALQTKEDGTLYYQIRHIKSIGDASEECEKGDFEEKPSYEHVKNFHAVLKEMLHCWVRVNRGGPESLEGVLTEVDDDYITVVHNKEVYRVLVFHIRNISEVDKSKENSDGENKNEGSNENKQNKNKNKNENKNKNSNKKRKSVRQWYQRRSRKVSRVYIRKTVTRYREKTTARYHEKAAVQYHRKAAKSRRKHKGAIRPRVEIVKAVYNSRGMKEVRVKQRA